MQPNFDLNLAIANWRAFLSNQYVFERDDLDELESHLREEIESRRNRGVLDEVAFRGALSEIGDLSELEKTFREVRSDKIWRKGNRRVELRARLALAANYVAVAWRRVRREWSYSALNVAGLTKGDWNSEGHGRLSTGNHTAAITGFSTHSIAVCPVRHTRGVCRGKPMARKLHR